LGFRLRGDHDFFWRTVWLDDFCAQVF